MTVCLPRWLQDQVGILRGMGCDPGAVAWAAEIVQRVGATAATMAPTEDGKGVLVGWANAGGTVDVMVTELGEVDVFISRGAGQARPGDVSRAVRAGLGWGG